MHFAQHTDLWFQLILLLSLFLHLDFLTYANQIVKLEPKELVFLCYGYKYLLEIKWGKFIFINLFKNGNLNFITH